MPEPATTAGEWAFATAAEDAVHDGRLGDAEHLLLQRIASHPADAEAQGLHAVVLHRLGRLDEALDSARTAHALAPADPLFAANLVLIALDAGAGDLARTTLEHARTLPEFPIELLVALDERMASTSEVAP